MKGSISVLKNKIPYILAFALIVSGSIWFFSCQQSEPRGAKNWNEILAGGEEKPAQETKNQNQADKKNEEDTTEIKAPAIIYVDVKGAVVRPNVYAMHVGERVIDAIKKAGGVTTDGDETRVNFAKKLVDEMVIFVPKKGETGQTPPPFQPTTGSNGGEGEKININTASASELEALPGIGPSKAAAIVEYRKQNGPFKTLDDLVNVSGIGDKSLENIKPKASVN